MGWCSATSIFDDVMGALESAEVPINAKNKVAEILYDSLTQQDWDCESDSDYFVQYIAPILLRRGDIDQEEYEEYARLYS